MSNAIWLADVLRAAGCNVIERPGWKTRGRGELGNVRGVILHHTGATASRDSAVRLIEEGREDLPGPLSQMVLDKDGTFILVGAGRCNHAGRGAWQGVVNGNSEMLGIEARNDGKGEPWLVAQISAYATGVAAILEHIGADSVMAVGHKEWALPKGRKVDPSFDMSDFREAVEALMVGGDVVLPGEESPHRAMLRKGSRGASVKDLQRLLGIAPDGDFGPRTEAALMAFQKSRGLVADGRAGPKTWAALGIK